MIKTQKKYEFEPDYAVPPGVTLHEVMTSLGMTQKELAQRTGLTEQTLIRVFKGEQPISYETANRLELVTEVPASMWNNLEIQYREQLTKLAERQRLSADLAWLKDIPTRELTERGFIAATDDKISQLRQVLSFFRVSSVDAWRTVWSQPTVAARRSKCFESRPGAAATWIRQGEIQAQQIDCEQYDKACFQRVLLEIRKLTRREPEFFEPELKRLCASAGVAVALVKEMKKVPWNGATKWLAPDKVMILLNLRGKGEDKFWFSFFHEACHVLKDKKKDLLINDETHDDPRERQADEYAAEILIPQKYNSQIAILTTKKEIILCAERVGVSPGIIVGRYYHLTGNWHRFHDLIRKFHWKRGEH